jgi:hypothetical protein
MFENYSWLGSINRYWAKIIYVGLFWCTGSAHLLQELKHTRELTILPGIFTSTFAPGKIYGYDCYLKMHYSGD